MPLKRLWGLTSSSTHTRDTRSGVTRIDSIPPAPAIARACSAVDYRTITFHPADTALTLHDPRTKIDVGGIAKGYVLQALDRLLGTRGITDFLIDAGGDILVRGRKADGTPWRIGIQHPAGPGLIAAVSLRRGALVTSGDYERFVMIDSIRYGHIIDAHTGMPCRRNRSVSVWSPDPIRADILSTAFFCMSADSILSFVNERDSLHCMVVDSHDIIHVSRGWKEKVTLFSDTTAH
jgi:thiamine biosynthesis lipoprotein